MRKGGDERTRRARIFSVKYVYDTERHLGVRDCLLAHPTACEQYAKESADMNPYDIRNIAMVKHSSNRD